MGLGRVLNGGTLGLAARLTVTAQELTANAATALAAAWQSTGRLGSQRHKVRKTGKLVQVSLSMKPKAIDLSPPATMGATINVSHNTRHHLNSSRTCCWVVVHYKGSAMFLNM